MYLVFEALLTLRVLQTLPISLQVMYQSDPDVLEGMFEFLAENLMELSTTGMVLKDGSRFWLVPIGVKGDWPFLVTWLSRSAIATQLISQVHVCRGSKCSSEESVSCEICGPFPQD